MNTLLLGSKPHLRLAYPPSLREEIRAHSCLDPVEADHTEWRELGDRLARATAIFSTWGMPALDAEFLEAAPALQAVFYAAGSVKAFATSAAFERGIVICSAWRANGIPVAEFTLAAIIFSLKNVWSYLRRRPEEICLGQRIPCRGAYHSKVGLVSLGAIGRAVARRMACLEVDLYASDPYADAQTAADLGVSLMPLPDLFATCDVVSVHTPWLPETEGLITGELVATMPHGATLINTARGALIREDELCAVLRQRPDLHAVLDVTHPEPPRADSPLLTLPNVFLTPHIAGSMDGEVTRMGRWMVDEFLRFVHGQPLEHQVLPEMMARLA